MFGITGEFRLLPALDIGDKPIAESFDTYVMKEKESDKNQYAKEKFLIFFKSNILRLDMGKAPFSGYQMTPKVTLSY